MQTARPTDLNDLSIFARVADTRSFSVAAEQLGLSTSVVSKAVARLERDLGVTLLQRSTRSVMPTVEGNEFLESCRRLLGDIDDAVAAVRGRPDRPGGRLRVVLPQTLGQRVIMPALRELAQRHPELVFDCELTDRVPDVLYEGLDCAVQIGPLADERLVARRLGTLRFHACASPEYLRRHGEPRTPDDLHRHHCLAFVVPRTGQYREWTFQCDGRLEAKKLAGRMNVNAAEVLLDAAIAGEGIAMLTSYTIAEAVAAGRLRVLLKGYEAEGPPVWLVYPRRRNVSPKVRLFTDFVTGLFPGVAAWDREIQARG